MSNYENIKTQFDTGVENVKNAIIGSIKSVLSKENVTIDISLKDEEASKASPSELKFPCIVSSFQSKVIINCFWIMIQLKRFLYL